MSALVVWMAETSPALDPDIGRKPIKWIHNDDYDHHHHHHHHDVLTQETVNEWQELDRLKSNDSPRYS